MGGMFVLVICTILVYIHGNLLRMETQLVTGPVRASSFKAMHNSGAKDVYPESGKHVPGRCNLRVVSEGSVKDSSSRELEKR